jgi:polar amino acid transport system substrate-binding protein
MVYYLNYLITQIGIMSSKLPPVINALKALKLLLASVLLAVLSSVNATELTVAFVTDRAPYCFKINDIDSGIEIDLIRAALKPYGYTVKPIIVPKVRLSLTLKTNEADIAATIQGKDGNGLFFSDDYIQFHNHAISKKKKNIKVNTLADLDKYTFIIWQGGWKNLGAEFETTYKPDANDRFRANYAEAHSQISQARMFWVDRAELVIMDKKIFEHFKKLLRSEYNTDEEIVFDDFSKKQTNYPAAFRNQEIRNQFNEGLKKIRSDGSYQSIIDSYK